MRWTRTSGPVAKLKGRTIKISKSNSSQFSDLILAYYDSDLERITKKHFDYHDSQDHNIIVMIDGQIMDESYSLADQDYSSLNKIMKFLVNGLFDQVRQLIHDEAALPGVFTDIQT